MKPVELDRRTGRLTLEQYLGLADGMSLRIAGRMLTLAAEYTKDSVIDLHDDALDPRLTSSALTTLARAATRAETHLARLLVLRRGALPRRRSWPTCRSRSART